MRPHSTIRPTGSPLKPACMPQRKLRGLGPVTRSSSAAGAADQASAVTQPIFEPATPPGPPLEGRSPDNNKKAGSNRQAKPTVDEGRQRQRAPPVRACQGPGGVQSIDSPGFSGKCSNPIPLSPLPSAPCPPITSFSLSSPSHSYSLPISTPSPNTPFPALASSFPPSTSPYSISVDPLAQPRVSPPDRFLSDWSCLDIWAGLDFASWTPQHSLSDPDPGPPAPCIIPDCAGPNLDRPLPSLVATTHLNPSASISNDQSVASLSPSSDLVLPPPKAAPFSCPFDSVTEATALPAPPAPMQEGIPSAPEVVISRGLSLGVRDHPEPPLLLPPSERAISIPSPIAAPPSPYLLTPIPIASSPPCMEMEALVDTETSLVTSPRLPAPGNHLAPPQGPIPGSLGLINAHSAVAHAIDIHDLITDFQLQVLAITETWMKPSSTACLHDLLPEHYRIISKPRLGKTGGGVALVYHSSLSFTTLTLSPEPTTFECLLNKGSPPGSPSVLFLTLYHPPEKHEEFLEEFQLVLEDLILTHDRIIVLGDFNIHFNKSTDPFSSQLQTLMSNLQFSQHLSGATHRLGNQLDLLFARNLSLSRNSITPLPWGDHSLLQASITQWLSYQVTPPAPVSKPKLPIRSYKSLTLQSLEPFWVPCTRSDLSVDDLDAIFHTKLVLARNQLCPIKLVNQKTAVHLRNKWFNPDLAQLKTTGRAIYRSWLKTHTRSDLHRWQKHQLAYKLAIKKAKRDYVQREIHSSSHSSRTLFNLTHALSSAPNSSNRDLSAPESSCQGLAHFFHDKVRDLRSDLDASVADPHVKEAQAFFATRPSSVNTLIPTCPQPTLQASPSPKPTFSCFAPVSHLDVRQAILHLGPSSSILDPLPTPVLKTLLDTLLPDITHLINTSLARGYVPAAWKRGVVTPLLKKAGLDPEVFKNFRPISQLCFLARLIEFIVTNQLQSYLEEHHILHDCQSGFRPSRGTELAVAEVRETLLRCADRSHPSLLILLDLSAAFDTVDHNILSVRLEEVAGISGVARDWIVSFLSNRVQRVRCGDTLSTEIPVPYGVPQGSSLSPLLFNLYLRPLVSLLDTIGLPFQCYADDTQLIVDLHESSDQAERLVPGLTLVQEWMRLNKLKLNGEKTELLGLPGTRGTPLPPVPWPPSWGPAPPLSLKVRDLGVWISHTLDGSAQAASMSSTGHFHLSALLKLFPLLTQNQKISLYHAFVGSRLSYGISVLLDASAKTVHQVQKVQNRAIRSIFHLSWRDHISPWRSKLGWLSISALISYRVCLWLWKALHHQGPLYQQRWATFRRGHHPLRSTHCNKLLPLAVKKARKGGRSIAHKGAVIWNSLPASIRALNSLPIFKRALKHHLLSLEHPHDVGAPHPGTSSSAPPILMGNIHPSSVPATTSRSVSSSLAPHSATALMPSAGAHGPRKSTLMAAACGLRNTVAVSPGPAPPASDPLHPSSSNPTPPTGPPSLRPPDFPPGPRLRGPPTTSWGVSSPPLPRRDNLTLIALAATNKARLLRDGYYQRTCGPRHGSLDHLPS